MLVYFTFTSNCCLFVRITQWIEYKYAEIEFYLILMRSNLDSALLEFKG